ncbi:amidase signature domain-containing protein [Zopfochytrium polystomum]|nr:amidase signature domain-containing protein [Zopfochytrium polystomum]
MVRFDCAAAAAAAADIAATSSSSSSSSPAQTAASRCWSGSSSRRHGRRHHNHGRPPFRVVATAAVAAVAGVLAVLASAPLSVRAAASPVPFAGAPAAPFAFDEATVQDFRAALDCGSLSSVDIVNHYLAKVDALNKKGPELRAVIETNPDILSLAKAADEERKECRSSLKPCSLPLLHGIPIILKDNIGTADKMQTTAGSWALFGSIPPRDAHVAALLRKAGALIFGKANLSEWANFRSSRNNTSGWSGRGGQTKNPYVLQATPCGSSSGSGAAVAANLVALALGSETDGSITCPSASNMLVGIKPTVGLTSRAGVIPLSHTQDTVGPMCRSVADAAAVLDVIAGPDPRDSATDAIPKGPRPSYTSFLKKDGLRGARLGVAWEFFDAVNDPVEYSVNVAALKTLERLGATLVNVTFPNLGAIYGDNETLVLEFDFKQDLKTYLADVKNTTIKSMADLIAYNIKDPREQNDYWGQDLLIASEATTNFSDPVYQAIVANDRFQSRDNGLDYIFKTFKVSAIVAPPLNGLTTPSAQAGYPIVTVPAGFSSYYFSRDFGIFNLTAPTFPVGLGFAGPAFSEGTLIQYAYAFEQATKARRPPKFVTDPKNPVQ